MIDDHAFPRLLDDVTEIGLSAAHAILSVYATRFAVDLKADASPLTEADRAAHGIITRALAALTPGIPVLSEESDPLQHAYATRSRWSQHWLVDPLDGTREFVNRNGEFTVNIALVRDHVAVLGVVVAPALDVTYSSAQGIGARKRSVNGTEAIRVQKPARSRPVIAGSRSHGGTSLERFLERTGPHELRSVGSALKFCLVAEGLADVYPRLGDTFEWDTAAGQAIVEAAGGSVVGLDGKPLRYNLRDTLRNPHFVAAGDTTRPWWQFGAPR